ncbi:hypothetical protein FIBSPDRAFT_894015 [Athelia psychrophila]|uniref:Uncharacterized protein n=1 Tax=Athelia psychrophila TaxID=1759441 RepID=A0A166GFC0_9AGAM|nr:hypothetical protein FIBSPDRAFT_894015 [Fibularhizoctonia sp. CBS 109695]
MLSSTVTDTLRLSNIVIWRSRWVVQEWWKILVVESSGAFRGAPLFSPLDDEGDSFMVLVSTEEIACSQGTILVPDMPPARPPPVIVSSSLDIPKTSSPQFVAPELHTPQPTSSIEAQRGTSPYLQHTHTALQNLGYNGPKSLNQLRAMLLILRRWQNFIFLRPTGFVKG